MNDLDKLNTLIHYMKGAEQFSQTFRFLTRESSTWCPFTHRGGKLNADCYNANPRVRALLTWSHKYLQCVKFLDVNRYSVDEMSAVINKLDSPEKIKDHDDFKTLLNQLKMSVRFVEPGVTAKLEYISCQECSRLDEALVCFSNYSFMASVVMAVSAVETRIVELIRKKSPGLYKLEFSRYTLGQLIQIFDEDKYKGAKYVRIKKLMPDKHKPLLSLLNKYRIYSVHPKDETVTPQIAESILHLAFAFLLDRRTCPYRPAQLKCV